MSSRKSSRETLGETSDYSYGDPRFLKGPPFNPKDYIISPSVSESSIKPTIPPLPPAPKKDLLSCDFKFGAKWGDDWQAALRKLHELIRDKFAVKFINRQRDLVSVFVKGTPIGFMLEDIQIISEVMRHFAKEQINVPEYFEYLKSMLKVASGPPKLAKSSDVLYYHAGLSEYLTMLGELLIMFADESIQLQILETLHFIIIRDIPTDINCIKASHCHAAMEQSHLPRILATLLETVPDNLYLKYLDITLHMASVSILSGQSLIENKALEFVLWRLDPFYACRVENVQPIDLPVTEEDEIGKDEYYKSLELATRLLWGLLSIMSDFGVKASCPPLKCLWSLRYIFHLETRKKNRRAMDMRNNLAALIVKLFGVFGNDLAICQAGLAADIAMISVATEIGTQNTWAEDLKFNVNSEDFLLKRLMLLGCCELIMKDECSVKIMKTQKVMEGVLHLINPKLTPLTVPWSPDQFLDLLFIALRTLSELAPALPDVFVANKGTTRLLLTLEWLMEEHFDQKPLLETLMCLCNIVSCKNNQAIVQDVKEQYWMKTILDVCNYVLSSPELKRIHYEELSRAFTILELLLKNDKKHHDSCGDSCVAISLKLLKKISAASCKDSKLDPRLLLAFGSFLWEVIVWYPKQRKFFIESGGVFLILDLIQMSILPVQILYCGVLVDMTDEGETIPHLLTWRGRKGYGVLTLLIEIWKEEEKLNQVKRSELGVISDVENPLMTNDQWYLTHRYENSQMCSPSIVEMVGSARPKIHGLYQLLKQRYIDRTKIAEESYKLQLESIPDIYQVYVPLIEHFLELKLGEVWYEVLKDLDITGIFPTSFDAEMISSLIDQKNKLASRVKTTQEEILALQKMKDIDEENSFYDFLKNCRLAESLEALRELDFIARTSCKEFQKQKKERQMREIESSISSFLAENDNIHRTFTPNTNITFLYRHHVLFQNERETLLTATDVQLLTDSSDGNDTPKSE